MLPEPRNLFAPLDFLRGLGIKNGVEILCIDRSFGIWRQFFLLVSFYSSQVAAKTRGILRGRSIWVALMGEQKVVRRETPSPTGTGIAPTEARL